MGVRKFEETSVNGVESLGGVFEIDDFGRVSIGDLLNELSTEQLRRLKMRIDNVINMRGD